MKDDEILKYIYGYYGSGNLKAPYWFVGMEDGGGKTRNEVDQRLLAWVEQNRPIVVDLPKYSEKFEANKWFEKGIIQPTWKYLIALLLAQNNIPVLKENVRDYQKEKFGKLNGENCLLELMPLPCKNIKFEEWKYHKWYPDVNILKDKQTYITHVRPQRIKYIRQLIKKYQPELVHFYSTSNDFVDAWEEISMQKHWLEYQTLSGLTVKYCLFNGTVYLITPHTVVPGLKYSDFESIGKYLKPYIIKRNSLIGV
jgi:hypothetical protein